MKIEITKSRGVGIIKPDGKITLGEGDIKLREAVMNILDSGTINILVNLENVVRIDSSGIGELVSAYTTTNNRGGKLKLCCIPNKIIQILQITQLISVFEIYHEESEALASF